MPFPFGLDRGDWMQFPGSINGQGLFNGQRPHDGGGTLFLRLFEQGYGDYLWQHVPVAGEGDTPAHLFASALDDATHDFGPAQVLSQPNYAVEQDGETGEPIVHTVIDYTPRMISQTIVSQAALDSAGVANGFDDFSGLGYVGNLATNIGEPSYSGLFVLFGQFLDHGLDLIGRGGNSDPASGSSARIIVPFAQNDPLYALAPNHQFSIARSTVLDFDRDGAPIYANHTSPALDQNQTYGSDPAITDLLREWVEDPNEPGTFMPGMRMLVGNSLDTAWTRWDGVATNQTLPTVTELRIAVHETLNPKLGRTDLTMADMFDYHGTGQALLLDFMPVADGIDTVSPDNIFGTGPNILQGVILEDLLVLVPENPGDTNSRLLVLGIQPGADPILAGEAMLQAIGDHYVAGDGRANENIGLTSLHHIFHQEHNYQVDWLIHAITTAFAAGEYRLDQLRAWQTPVKGAKGRPLVDAADNYVDANGDVAWDQDRLFEAAKLIVQLEEQQVAIAQYAAMVSPDLGAYPVGGASAEAAISLEFSQAAFRFGHSQLRETIDVIDPDGGITGQVLQLSLASAFLNPEEFAQTGPGAIALGMSHQLGAETDEFVTPTLQQSLLGQPLDLPAINIARGRDVGLPTLNEARAQILEALSQSGSSLSGDLAPYTSWNDFAAAMLHPQSLVHFIAAYSFDGDQAAASAAMTDEAFMSGGDQGFQRIDLWIGGLAERHVDGGILGPTFNAIFVDQIERLVTGDQWQDLARLDAALPGDSDLFGNLLALPLKDIIERTTGTEHLAGNVFFHADSHLELTAVPTPSELAQRGSPSDPHKYGDLASGLGLGIHSDAAASTMDNGDTIEIDGTSYVVDGRPNGMAGHDGVRPGLGFDAHEVIVGSSHADWLHAGGGFDTVYGDAGSDMVFGGEGNDYLYGEDGDDLIEGGPGNDFLDGGTGLDVVSYSGMRTDYSIASVQGVLRITDNRPGSPDGTDTVRNVEMAQFTGISFDLLLYDEYDGPGGALSGAQTMFG